MTFGVLTITPDTRLLDAAKIMGNHGFAGIPVVDEKGVLVGILTEYDLISKGSALHLPTLQKLLQDIPVNDHSPEGVEKIISLAVRDLMNKEPAVFTIDSDIADVVKTFRDHHRVNPIPVVDENRKVIGIVSRSDILKLFDKVPSQPPVEAIVENALALLQKNYMFLSAIAEEGLAEGANYSQTFRDAIISSADAVIITDIDADIIYVNPAWERLTGYSFDEVRGKNPRFLQSGKTPKEVYKKMWDALTSGSPFITEEIVNRCKNGSEFQEEITQTPVKRGGKTEFYIGITRDITRRKEIDRAKSEYVSLTAHQLATPLTIIGWNADALLSEKRGALGQDQREYLEQIKIAANSMRELSDTFLNAAKIEAGTLKLFLAPVALPHICDAVINGYVPTIKEKNIHIAKEYDEHLPEVISDERLLRIIVQNLISNSLKYTPEQGTVAISVKRSGVHFVLSVRDTGFGIPKDEQEKVFSKLFRARNVTTQQGEGTGLGLYIVKMAVNLLGGKIWFVSAEGEGTTFFVEIPFSGTGQET